jgi:flagellar biogenesis protein FliO
MMTDLPMMTDLLIVSLAVSLVILFALLLVIAVDWLYRRVKIARTHGPNLPKTYRKNP